MTIALSIAMVIAGLGATVGVAGRLRANRLIGAEAARKSVHVGMGVIAMTFPWLFTSVAPVLFLAVLALIALGCVRMIPRLRRDLGCALHDVGRKTVGEFAFVFGVAGTFIAAAGDTRSYVTAIAVLTFADTFAALVGRRLGAHRFRTLDGSKSVEGSAAFLFVSTACIALPMVILGDPHALATALIVSVTLTVIEAVGCAGLDNIAIPIAGGILMRFCTENFAVAAR